MKCLPVFLLVGEEPQTMKVFNIKEHSDWWSLPLPAPGEAGDGQRPPATGSTALYWCHEKTEAALHRPIKLYQQLAGCPPQPGSLSLSTRPPCVSLPRSVPPLSASFPQKHTLGSSVSSHGAMALLRAPPSPHSLPGDKYLLCCPDLFWVN